MKISRPLENLALHSSRRREECFEKPGSLSASSPRRRLVQRTVKSLFAAAVLAVATAAFAAEDGFNQLFNGRDLTGWDGNPKFWSVKDGLLTGQTTAGNPTKGNTFIIWKDGTVGDFELRLSYKIIGGNSGIQYRSKVVDPTNWVVGGYQADFEAGKTYSGINYEERGRGILAQRGQKTVVKADPADPNKPKIEVVGNTGKSSEELQAAIRNEDWNDYVVIARGNQLIHNINGNVTSEVTDEQTAKAAKSGVLALQLHAGPPMTVQFRNIRLKPLTSAAPARTDLESVQGDWVATEFVANGDRLDAAALAAIKLNIKGRDYSVETDNGPSTGTFELNPATRPRAMDVTTSDGAEIPAIYEVSGDSMKVCYAINGASRPDTFTSTSGSDRVSVVYKRKSK